MAGEGSKSYFPSAHISGHYLQWRRKTGKVFSFYRHTSPGLASRHIIGRGVGENGINHRGFRTWMINQYSFLKEDQAGNLVFKITDETDKNFEESILKCMEEMGIDGIEANPENVDGVDVAPEVKNADRKASSSSAEGDSGFQTESPASGTLSPMENLDKICSKVAAEKERYMKRMEDSGLTPTFIQMLNARLKFHEERLSQQKLTGSSQKIESSSNPSGSVETPENNSTNGALKKCPPEVEKCPTKVERSQGVQKSQNSTSISKKLEEAPKSSSQNSTSTDKNLEEIPKSPPRNPSKEVKKILSSPPRVAERDEATTSAKCRRQRRIRGHQVSFTRNTGEEVVLLGPMEFERHVMKTKGIKIGLNSSSKWNVHSRHNRDHWF